VARGWVDEEPVALSMVNAEQLRSRINASTEPCPRCGLPVPVLRRIDITELGDPQPRFLPVLGPCRTEGCGTTCVTCRRPPGEVHGPGCWDRMRDKLTDPHIVDKSDCTAEVARG
jgi:hypothetical protein